MRKVNYALKLKKGKNSNLVLEEIFHSSSDHEVEIQGEVQQIKAGTQRGCVPYIFGYDQLIEDGVCKEMNVGSGPLAVLRPRVCFCKSELCNGHDFKELKEPQELEKCNSSGIFNNSIITISILVFVSYLLK